MSESHNPGPLFRGGAVPLLVLGLVLPVGPFARAIEAAGGPDPSVVAPGLWLFKLGLVVAAVSLYVLGRIPVEPGWSAGRPGRDGGWVLWAFVAVGLVLRLVELNAGLWFDEILTLVSYVRLPLPGTLTVFDSTQNNHLLFSGLARVSVQAFGEHPWSLRLPAVLFGVGSLWAAYGFARRLVDRPEALLVTAALAASYHHVWFSQNARGYTALLFFTIVASSLFLDLVHGRGGDPRRTVVLYALSCALAVYAHLTGVFFAVIHAGVALVLWLRGGRDAAFWPAAGILGAIVAGFTTYAVVLPQFIVTGSNEGVPVGASDWKNVGWLVREMTLRLAAAVPGGYVTLAAGALLGGAGVASLGRRDPAALAIMVLPGVVGTAVLLIADHNLWPRFYFFLAAFAVLIGIRGACAVGEGLLGARGLRITRYALGVAVAAGAVLVPSAWGPKQSYGEAHAYLRETTSPGDAVATVGLTSIPFDRYLDAGWPTVPTAEDLRRLEERHETVRIVLSFPIQVEAEAPDVWARIATDYTLERTFPATLGGGEIFVYARR